MDMNKTLLVSGLSLVVACPPVRAGEIVKDGGFETGTPNAFWDEFSQNFDSPICNTQRCGRFFGDPFEGDWWVWFGGPPVEETGWIAQEVTIPAGTATLTFQLDITAASGNGTDFMLVTIDDETVFQVMESQRPQYDPWTEVAVDISAYADGGTHTLMFESTTHGGQDFSNFFVDVVAIAAEPSGCTRDPQWVCDGDVDGNGAVNPVDVGLVQAAFCSASDCSDTDLCQYDLDCNGAINPVDAGLVQSLFGLCNTPRDVCP
jgi:hypothetical protein